MRFKFLGSGFSDYLKLVLIEPVSYLLPRVPCKNVVFTPKKIFKLFQLG